MSSASSRYPIPMRPVLVAALIGTLSCAKGERREFLDPTLPANPTILQSVAIQPKFATTATNDLTTFTAIGRSTKGDPIPVEIEWSASGGTVFGPGSYYARTPGTYSVYARAKGSPTIADSATVTVTAPTAEIVWLEIDPPAATVAADAQMTFSAKAYLSDGSTKAVTPDWEATGGIIDHLGEYRAGPTPGEYEIAASVGSGLGDRVRISIASRRAQLVRLELEPSTASVDVGGQLSFHPLAQWSDGSTNLPPLKYVASGGTINSEGRYLAGTHPGIYPVIVRSLGGEDLADTALVTITPNIVGRLVVSPGSASLAPGASVQFSADGFRSTGEPTPAVVTWTATGGTISAGGLYQAGNLTGSFQVIARDNRSGVADTARLEIRSPSATVTSLAISPTAISLPSGAAKQFSVAAQWSNGATTVPAITWTATGGSISSSGAFVAGGAQGTFRVIAAVSGGTVADTATVTVLPPAIIRLDVTPPSGIVTAGSVIQYTATALQTDGVTIPGPVSWSATGGSITSSGAFTAGQTAGNYLVIGTCTCGLADTASVTVSVPPSLQSVSLNPASATVTVGGTQQFGLTGVWSDGATRPLAATYAATGGTIDAAGLFRAGQTAGSYRVIGVAPNGLADTSAISVTAAPPVLTGIAIAPSTASLQPGSTLQFGAVGVWTNGGTGNPAVTYSATGGTITSGGLYTAGATAGSYRVVARQQSGTFADTASVTISIPAATLTRLTVAPDPANVPAGDLKQFVASAVWSDGSTTVPPVTWSATGGVINAAGGFTAGTTQASGYRVVVRHQGGTAADTASVAVTTPTLRQVMLTPGSTAVQIGQTKQFTVAGVWSDGSAAAPAVSYTATGGTVSSTGMYTAGTTAGTFRVIARQTGGTLADTSQISVSSVTLVSLTLNPGSVQLSAGASQQFSASGIWSDGSTTAPPVSYTGTGGTISASGLYTAGSTAGTYVVVATHLISGKADTATITLTAPALQAVEMTPPTASLVTGGVQQFTALGRYAGGSTGSVTVAWSATGGTVTSSGLYTAGTAAGSFRVVAANLATGMADTATVTLTTPVLQAVEVTPPSASLLTGGVQQFTALGRYAGGTTGSVSVAWSATGGTVTSSGLYTAGTATGSFRVIAANPASGKADTSAVTIAAAPPPPPPGNYVPWLRRDWAQIANKATAQNLGFGVEGSPSQCNVPPDQTWDLVADPLWGKVIRYLGSPSFNAPGYTVGCTAVHGVSVAQGPPAIWVRQFIKYSPTWTPSPGTGYKAMFLRFQTVGRMQIEVAPTAFYNRSDAPNAGGAFIVRNPAPSCPGWQWPSDRGIPRGMYNVTYDCKTSSNVSWPGAAEWWEYVMGYLPSGGTLTSVWAYRKYTTAGVVAPEPWTVDIRQATGGPWPLVGHYEMGVNRNSIYEDVMHIDWGPYELVDGTIYRNPFSIPGVP